LKQRSASPVSAAKFAAEVEVIVVPDLHGCSAALEAILLHAGFVDAQGKPLPSALHLVQLGDLIDRGPQPRLCVTRLMSLKKAAKGRVHVLKGNHEAMALEALQDPAARPRWLQNGGTSTLRDYDGSHQKLLKPGGAHFSWLEALPLSLEIHGVLFCHAGLGRKRQGQLTEAGLLWDRPPLSRGPYQAVVCGHTRTPSGRIEVKAGVYACDLGLGYEPAGALEYLRLKIRPQGLQAVICRIR
jgi:serine/threonine protein phosphatase 1